jgi:hypothetical protein
VTQPQSDVHQEVVRLQSQIQSLAGQTELSPRESNWLLSNSPGMRAITKMIDQVAATDATVLVWGESGVGKELVARALHQRSGRRERPFVKVNCAALPLELLESELFGYERGAFTGAHRNKPGKFELADSGTICPSALGAVRGRGGSPRGAPSECASYVRSTHARLGPPRASGPTPGTLLMMATLPWGPGAPEAAPRRRRLRHHLSESGQADARNCGSVCPS